MTFDNYDNDPNSTHAVSSSPSHFSRILSSVATLLHLLSAKSMFSLKVEGRIPRSIIVCRATSAADAVVAPIRTSESAEIYC